MNAHVLFNLFNELGKSGKMPRISSFFETKLINSIIQEHEC